MSYGVQFELLLDDIRNPAKYWVRVRPDKFGSWYTSNVKFAKTWKRVLNAENWIDSREGFRNRYAAKVVGLNF